jgi:EamA domain-containing membrane protein RarD
MFMDPCLPPSLFLFCFCVFISGRRRVGHQCAIYKLPILVFLMSIWMGSQQFSKDYHCSFLSIVTIVFVLVISFFKSRVRSNKINFCVCFCHRQ